MTIQIRQVIPINNAEDNFYKYTESNFDKMHRE